MWKPRLDPSRYPEKTGGEGWLLNEQCLLVEFKLTQQRIENGQGRH